MLGRNSIHTQTCVAEDFIGADYGIRQDLTGKLPADWRAFNQEFISAYLAKRPDKTKIAAGLAIEKIVRECREHGIDSPQYGFSMSGLMLTFHANPRQGAHAAGSAPVGKTADRLGERLGERLGKTRAAIVQAMWANPQITITQLAESLGLSTTAVEKNLRILKTQGYVRRIGPARGGHWEVRLDEHE